jgi:hypothetical protein
MIGMLPRTEDHKSQYKLEYEKGPYQWSNLVDRNEKQFTYLIWNVIIKTLHGL